MDDNGTMLWSKLTELYRMKRAITLMHTNLKISFSRSEDSRKENIM